MRSLQTYTDGLMDKTEMFNNAATNTPNVAYSYDNFGRPLTVTQSKNGTGTSPALTTQTYAYDAANLVLKTETIAYDTDADGTADFTRTITRSQDNRLRPQGFDLKNGTATEHSTTYGYDSASRLATVANNTDTFTYGYQYNNQTAPTPARIGAIGGTEQDFMPYTLTRTSGHTVTNTYEAHRNVLTIKENSVISVPSVVSKFNYTTNNLGQRTALTTSGKGFDASAFTNTSATGPAYTWTYNSAGELTQADDTSAANNDRAFEYDGIGNRKKSANSLTLPGTDNYTVNALNQYTAVPSLPSAPSYDNDGNMTAGQLPAHPTAAATLLWDAENRLVSTTTNSSTINYSYDAQSRRTVKQPVGGTATHYIYDGWNTIAEYTGITLNKSYTWGMDLSGSMQGAGGVGGLLAVNDGTSSYYPTYDGNGNVSEYLDSTNAVQAHYEYDAFGNITVATGTKKDDFAHRFSTKPLDAETGLYYYGYRYYDPVTGRWPSRDPIKEAGSTRNYFRRQEIRLRREFWLRSFTASKLTGRTGSAYFSNGERHSSIVLKVDIGSNLYGFVNNNSVNTVDFLGLAVIWIPGSDGKPAEPHTTLNTPWAVWSQIIFETPKTDPPSLITIVRNIPPDFFNGFGQNEIAELQAAIDEAEKRAKAFAAKNKVSLVCLGIGIYAWKGTDVPWKWPEMNFPLNDDWTLDVFPGGIPGGDDSNGNPIPGIGFTFEF